MTISFHTLYQRYAQDVYRFAVWLCGNADDADDITSETFLRAWASDSPVRTETVKAYLFTIARRIHLRQRQKASNLAPLSPHTPAPSMGLEQIVSDRVLLDAVSQRLASLTETDRTAFILRTAFDLPYREIAHILSISEGAAKVKVHRARLKLNRLREEHR